MIVIGATPHDILSDPSLTPEEKRELLHMLPKKIKVTRLRSPYFAYGETNDMKMTLTVVKGGVVKSSFEWDAQRNRKAC